MREIQQFEIFQTRSSTTGLSKRIRTTCPHCSHGFGVDVLFAEGSTSKARYATTRCGSCGKELLFVRILPPESSGNESSAKYYINSNGNELKDLQNLLSRYSSEIPSRIISAVRSALGVYDIYQYESSIQESRRALEMILKDLDLVERRFGLEQLIDESTKLGKLGRCFKKVALAIKYAGDHVAHSDAAVELMVSREDAMDLLNFVKFILESVYIMPRKADIIAQRFKRG